LKGIGLRKIGSLQPRTMRVLGAALQRKEERKRAEVKRNLGNLRLLGVWRGLAESIPKLYAQVDNCTTRCRAI